MELDVIFLFLTFWRLHIDGKDSNLKQKSIHISNFKNPLIREMSERYLCNAMVKRTFKFGILKFVNKKIKHKTDEPIKSRSSGSKPTTHVASNFLFTFILKHSDSEFLAKTCLKSLILKVNLFLVNLPKPKI
jgi:hypothetical protein